MIYFSKEPGGLHPGKTREAQGGEMKEKRWRILNGNPAHSKYIKGWSGFTFIVEERRRGVISMYICVYLYISMYVYLYQKKRLNN